MLAYDCNPFCGKIDTTSRRFPRIIYEAYTAVKWLALRVWNEISQHHTTSRLNLVWKLGREPHLALVQLASAEWWPRIALRHMKYRCNVKCKSSVSRCDGTCSAQIYALSCSAHSGKKQQLLTKGILALFPDQFVIVLPHFCIFDSIQSLSRFRNHCFVYVLT